MLKSCRRCALAVKLPPINYQPWPNIDKLCSRLHVHYKKPFNGLYYFIIVDSFSKWPEIYVSKTHFHSTLDFLHKPFSRFEVPDTTAPDNCTQFTSSDFQIFLKYYSYKPLLSYPR